MDEINRIVKTPKLVPKYAPIRCIVCNGHGTVTYQRVKCHGCNGKGYILVEAKEDQT